jgi:hypothetical protein
MADLKISALTASTTPLAGTEVLPIVQSSTTKQVSVANLTAGRAVSASSLTTTGTINSITVGLGGGAVASATAVGSLALAATNTGVNTTAFGYRALTANTSGYANIGIGASSLASNTTGVSNVAIGTSALATSSTAVANTALGHLSGTGITSGTENVLLGYGAGQGLTTGNYNTLVGRSAGYFGGVLDTGSNNTYVGYEVNPSSSSVTNEIIIGTNAQTGKGANTGFIAPSTGGVYQGNNSAAWSITSDERIKKNIVDNNIGLSVINQIKVRNFEYRLPEEITDVPQDQAIAKTGIQLGVIAQELQQILPECVKTESTGVMTVDTDNLTWYLINAVKELKAELDLYKASHP